MKPATPLLTHNASKSSISREQRCHRFHPTTKTGPQRCQRFQPGIALHRRGKQCTRAHTVARATRQCAYPRSTMPLRNAIRKVRTRPIIPHAIPTQPDPASTQNPQNSNDQTPNHETHSRELHAKLPLGGGLAWLRADALSHAQQHGAAGVKGAGGTGGARGRRRGLARQHTDTPTDWRPPRGLRGLAGLRADAPSEARGADGERAGRPRGGRRSVGATSNSSRRGRRAGGPPPTGTHSGRALRRPERQRRHKKHSTGARARRPAPLDATTQTRQLRSTDVPCRSARAARRSRRSSRNPRLRRRAGPRR